jgi:hypothetical protein
LGIVRCAHVPGAAATYHDALPTSWPATNWAAVVVVVAGLAVVVVAGAWVWVVVVGLTVVVVAGACVCVVVVGLTVVVVAARASVVVGAFTASGTGTAMVDGAVTGNEIGGLAPASRAARDEPGRSRSAALSRVAPAPGAGDSRLVRAMSAGISRSPEHSSRATTTRLT